MLVAGVSLKRGTRVSLSGAALAGAPEDAGRGKKRKGFNIEELVRKLVPGQEAKVQIRRRPRHSEIWTTLGGTWRRRLPDTIPVGSRARLRGGRNCVLHRGGSPGRPIG